MPPIGSPAHDSLPRIVNILNLDWTGTATPERAERTWREMSKSWSSRLEQHILEEVSQKTVSRADESDGLEVVLIVDDGEEELVISMPYQLNIQDSHDKRKEGLLY